MNNLPTAVRRHLSALRMLLLMTVVCGLIYPLVVTGIAQVAFSNQANGSLVHQNGKVVGSSLIGQNFNLPLSKGQTVASPDPKFFQPRPSAGSYDPLASGATNLGPNNPDLVTTIQQRRQAIAAFDGVPAATVPADALTASGSGLEPDISKAYAYEQVNRVAKARGLNPAAVHKLVADHVTGRTLGFMGESHVNVVLLNRDLAKLS